MSETIKRLTLEELRPDLAASLKARVERLGYLGEFFRIGGHQPDALMAFQQYTDASKAGLDKRHVELIALTVAAVVGNAYELNQHERLCVRSDFGREWVKAVELLCPDESGLPTIEAALQHFVIDALATHGRGMSDRIGDLADSLGQAQAVAVLMVMGRYLVHGLIVNVFDLAPPVPSIFEDGFAG
jgi:alkylhydroperoxidase/carboxymuconolactone decarboxylase family protein YurZ